jgi:hypothetical protein
MQQVNVLQARVDVLERDAGQISVNSNRLTKIETQLDQLHWREKFPDK